MGAVPGFPTLVSPVAYVSFDGDTDMQYYRLLQAWSAHKDIDFSLRNAHDLNTARDSSEEESIKRQLRERLRISDVFLILVGANTRFLYKFVRWEIEQAIAIDLPIICSNLNAMRWLDEERCPPILRHDLAAHVSFNPKIIQYAFHHWPAERRNRKAQGYSGPHYYLEAVYRSLGVT